MFSGTSASNRPISDSGQLIGIMHKFKGKNMFVATKINEILQLVARKMPDEIRQLIET